MYTAGGFFVRFCVYGEVNKGLAAAEIKTLSVSNYYAVCSGIQWEKVGYVFLLPISAYVRNIYCNWLNMLF